MPIRLYRHWIIHSTLPCTWWIRLDCIGLIQFGETSPRKADFFLRIDSKAIKSGNKNSDAACSKNVSSEKNFFCHSHLRIILMTNSRILSLSLSYSLSFSHTYTHPLSHTHFTSIAHSKYLSHFLSFVPDTHSVSLYLSLWSTITHTLTTHLLHVCLSLLSLFLSITRFNPHSCALHAFEYTLS